MALSDGRIHTAVVLQGGGALGAYECGVLTALYEQRHGFEPLAVSGISIGAVTAAVLGGTDGDPIAALEGLWCEEFTVSAPWPLGRLLPAVERSLAAVANPGIYRPNPALFTTPWKATSICDTTPLRRTLAEILDLQRLNRETPQVILGALDVGSGEMEYFDRHRPGGLTVDHVVASGSLPPGFPMTEIDGASYWDGGLFANLPLQPAIVALEGAAAGDPSAVRELIVVELFPMRAPIPRTLPDVLERMPQLQFSSRLTLDEAFFQRIDRLADLVEEVDRQLPDDSDLRNDPTYRELLARRKIDHVSVVTADLPRSCPTRRISPGPPSGPASRPVTRTPSGRGSVTLVHRGLRPGTTGRDQARTGG
ncbi:patatin-like phospholipase family protein [Geodermatophilus sabuli]|uniref:Predicted acylesterase/phospholipase RssA, contains patatin domain n=1 Tax=Geodermatophilus sabuli TaxID=1564158 RepID=A0A285ECD9_9ACTN|nr:patatin-like phospholipase family protein [Geodermatophilus sabuli]MBB3084069.1 putative acylesterase/phospholipase RssA [Geodermatophilus sabuli]SNX96657.1 Predicted acylesterase/phospholipase RssA, contains patatin domain [Geodermatophilus sabuli]